VPTGRLKTFDYRQRFFVDAESVDLVWSQIVRYCLLFHA